MNLPGDRIHTPAFQPVGTQNINNGFLNNTHKWYIESLTPCFPVQILKGAPTIEGRPGASMEPLNLARYKEDLQEQFGDQITDKDVISSALYPKVFADFEERRQTFGPVDKLDTKVFLVGPEIAEELQVGGCFL